MSEIFTEQPFANLNLDDHFFSSLKTDYPEFESWFDKKKNQGAVANILKVDNELAAFLYLKDHESEAIVLTDSVLPAVPRIKIGTLKIDEEISGKRLGEGAIGIALWHWFQSEDKQIYVTVFPKHAYLVTLLQKFGFSIVGKKRDTSEYVLVKDKDSLNYNNPYSSFPFINPEFKKGGLLVINESYHDKLFPYSTLRNIEYHNQVLIDAAGNGITKMYVSAAYSGGYDIGEPVLIYRKSEAATQRGLKSVVTSIGTIVEKTIVEENNQLKMSELEIQNMLGNKTVLNKNELSELLGHKNVTIYKIVYNYFLGAGNNINWWSLKKSGMWQDTYPTKFSYSNSELRTFVRSLNGDIINIIQ